MLRNYVLAAGILTVMELSFCCCLESDYTYNRLPADFPFQCSPRFYSCCSLWNAAPESGRSLQNTLLFPPKSIHGEIILACSCLDVVYLK